MYKQWSIIKKYSYKNTHTQTKEQLTILLYTNIGRSFILCHTTLALKMSNELSRTNTLTNDRL